MTYEEKLKSNADKGADILGDFLNGAPIKDLKIRAASTSVTQYQRFMATKWVFASMGFQIARAISSDIKELKKSVSPPQIPE